MSRWMGWESRGPHGEGSEGPDGARAAPVEGEAPAVAPQDSVVDRRYRVERVLARGGMGEVLLCAEVALDRKVALKLVRTPLLGRPEILRALRAEAAALASIRSPHVVQVYTYGFHDEVPYFAMEYVEGKDLFQVIVDHARRGEFVPLPRGLSILRRVAMGLQAVHDAGLLHLDVKPANILIEHRSGRPVLVDFGLATVRTARADPSESVRGTPLYMAPEQVRGESELTARADVYALACSAFELLTGQPPFLGRSSSAIMKAHLMDPVPRLTSFRPTLEAAEPVFLTALHKDAGKRYESPTAFVEALGRAFVLAGAAEADRETPAGRATEAHPRASPAPSTGDLATRILVVDDDLMFARLASMAAQHALSAGRVDVRRVASGAAALTELAVRRPDLVVLDYLMPGLSGIDTLTALRELPEGGDVPVLVCSSAVGEMEFWRFSVLGVEDFLRKPVDPYVLSETIADLLRRSQSMAGRALQRQLAGAGQTTPPTPLPAGATSAAMLAARPTALDGGDGSQRTDGDGGHGGHRDRGEGGT